MYENKTLINLQRKSIQIYATDFKRLARLMSTDPKKNAGGENEGFSHYVVENTRSENAFFALAIMLMKNKLVTVLRLLY